jgi:hypothetical protein
MSTDVANTVPIVVRIPAKLGLTKEQLDALQTKWLDDLSKAVGSSGSKIKWHITIHIEVGSE